MTDKPKRRRGKRNSEVFGQCDRDFQQYDKGFNHAVDEYDQWLKGRLAEALSEPNYELRRKIEALLKEASQ